MFRFSNSAVNADNAQIFVFYHMASTPPKVDWSFKTNMIKNGFIFKKVVSTF